MQGRGDRGEHVAKDGRSRREREQRERARTYQARTELFENQQRRRRRDNIVAGVVAGVLILGVVGGQLAFYTVGPGRPAPRASHTPSASPSPAVTP